MDRFNRELFAQDLREVRGDLSRDDFARKLELKASMIAMMEKGRQIPKIDLLTRIARMAGKSPDVYFADFEQFERK